MFFLFVCYSAKDTATSALLHIWRLHVLASSGQHVERKMSAIAETETCYVNKGYKHLLTKYQGK